MPSNPWLLKAKATWPVSFFQCGSSFCVSLWVSSTLNNLPFKCFFLDVKISSPWKGLSIQHCQLLLDVLEVGKSHNLVSSVTVICEGRISIIKRGKHKNLNMFWHIIYSFISFFFYRNLIKKDNVIKAPSNQWGNWTKRLFYRSARDSSFSPLQKYLFCSCQKLASLVLPETFEWTALILYNITYASAMFVQILSISPDGTVPATQSRTPRLLASRVPPQTFALAPPRCSKHKVCPPCPWLSPRVCLLAGVHHDRVPAAELARRPPVLQPHQQDAGAGQSVRGQAVAARHVHRQRQICLVPRCHRGEQVDPSAAQRSHFIQQPVRASRLLSSRGSYTDANCS